MAGIRMQNTDEKVNWARKLRRKSRLTIFGPVMSCFLADDLNKNLDYIERIKD
jgi:hypothetical protein